MIYFEGTKKYFILQHLLQDVVVTYNYDCMVNGFNFGEIDFYLNKKEEKFKIPTQELSSYLVLFSEENPSLELKRYGLNQSNYLFTTNKNKMVLDIPYDEFFSFGVDDFIYLWFISYKNIRKVIMQGTLRIY